LVHLNGCNFSNAGRNIKKIKKRYNFKNFEIKFSKNIRKDLKSGSEDHAMSLSENFSKINEKFDIENYDLILIEEFDVIHKKNYSKILKYVENSEKILNDYIASDINGFNLEYIDSNSRVEFNVENREYFLNNNLVKFDGEFRVRFSRILPHFAVVPVSSYNIFNNYLIFFNRFGPFHDLFSIISDEVKKN